MGQGRVRVVRLGLIGVGAWGRRYLETIRRREDCQILAFARASARPADGNGDGPPEVRQCDNWQDLVALAARGELDGVVVASTPSVQAEVAQAGVSAAVPLLVEKPLGFSAEVCRELLRQVQARPARVPFLVDYIHLWSPAYRQLKARVAGAIAAGGHITAVTSRGCNWGPFRSWSSLYDYGPHDLALLLDTLGGAPPLELLTVNKLVASQTPLAELFEVSLRCGDVKVQLAVGNGSPQKARLFTVQLGQGGQLSYDDTQPHPGKLRENGSAIPVPQTSPLDNVISEFVEQIGASSLSELSVEQAQASLSLSVKIADLLAIIAAAAKSVSAVDAGALPGGPLEG